jgi:hypothetical protein
MAFFSEMGSAGQSVPSSMMPSINGMPLPAGSIDIATMLRLLQGGGLSAGGNMAPQLPAAPQSHNTMAPMPPSMPAGPVNTPGDNNPLSGLLSGLISNPDAFQKLFGLGGGDLANNRPFAMMLNNAPYT